MHRYRDRSRDRSMGRYRDRSREMGGMRTKQKDRRREDRTSGQLMKESETCHRLLNKSIVGQSNQLLDICKLLAGFKKYC